MRLFGKYRFENLRDCLQGVFEFQQIGNEPNQYYILELWQIRITILPKKYIEVSLNVGQNKEYRSLGKITLSE